MKRDLNWLKAKADIRIGCFDMVSMGYAIEMYNEDQVHIEKLEKEIASLKEQLKEAEWVLVKFVPHKDTIQWDSREKLARDYFKRATQARREK